MRRDRSYCSSDCRKQCPRRETSPFSKEAHQGREPLAPTLLKKKGPSKSFGNLKALDFNVSDEADGQEYIDCEEFEEPQVETIEFEVPDAVESESQVPYGPRRSKRKRLVSIVKGFARKVKGGLKGLVRRQSLLFDQFAMFVLYSHDNDGDDNNDELDQLDQLDDEEEEDAEEGEEEEAEEELEFWSPPSKAAITRQPSDASTNAASEHSCTEDQGTLECH